MLSVKLVISLLISLLVACPKYALADYATRADAMVKKNYALAKKRVRSV